MHMGYGGKITFAGNDLDVKSLSIDTSKIVKPDPPPTVTKRWWLPALNSINLLAVVVNVLLIIWHMSILSDCRQLRRDTVTAQGLTAHHKGIGFTENPYSCETAPDMRLWWYEGWRRAELDERKRRAKPDFDRAIADKAQDE